MANFDELDSASIFSGGGIFERRELLRIGHVPEINRVVGRDEEIQSVGRALGPATRGGPPETIIIYGKTGTGKSLVSRCTTREAARNARSNGCTLKYAYVDCSNYATEAQASRQMARDLLDNTSIDKDIPNRGISAADYRDIVWDTLDEIETDSFITILDEVDKLNDDSLLHNLSRARESGIANCHTGVICISNKVNYKEDLNERVQSSLQENELIFHPYDATQLADILNNRKDAFKKGVLEEATIPKAAALAAKEHGDARKAVDTLYEAGRLAEMNGDSQVSVEHVDEALQQAEINRFQELISGSTPHVKHVLQALAILSNNQHSDRFRTSTIYDTYSQIAKWENSSPLSQDRVYRLLREQSFLGITESQRTAAGRNEGTYLQHQLITQPEVVLESISNSKEHMETYIAESES